MADKITTLHPENDTSINLYPNVKEENIPNTIARVSYVDAGDNENDLAISAVRADLDTEIADRKKDTADTNGRIDGLATDISILEERITGLGTEVRGISEELTEEIANRKNADTALGGRIDNVNTEISALKSENLLQSKQLETQRLEILDLKESTYQGLNEYEDTASFTEERTPIPNLLNNRMVVHGVRAILSSLDGDTKKVVASENLCPESGIINKRVDLVEPLEIGTYTISFVPTNSTSCTVVLYGDDGVISDYFLSSKPVANGSVNNKTITTTKIATQIGFWDTNSSAVYNNIMLVHGSTPKPYSPYYPYYGEPTLMGFVPKSVKMAGANLFKINDVPATTQNGVTYSVKDGIITLNGVCATGFDLTLSYPSPIALNGTYTAQVILSGNMPSEMLCSLTEYANYWDAIANQSKTFSTNGTTASYCWFRLKQGFAYNTTIKPMLSVGSTALPYEPYHEPVDLIPTSLLNVTLNKVGTAKDQLIVHQQENGLFGVTHRKEVGEVDLGSINWTFDSDIIRYTYHLSDIKYPTSNSVVANIQAVKYTTKSADTALTDKSGICVSTTALIVYGSESPTGYAYYELATPTETEIATDLSLSQVSALQNAGYLVEIEAETMKYGVKGSANLTMLTKGE